MLTQQNHGVTREFIICTMILFALLLSLSPHCNAPDFNSPLFLTLILVPTCLCPILTIWPYNSTTVGCDDAAAIAFALVHPQTTVHAVTTVFGNVSRAQSMINVYIILQMFGYNTDPIEPPNAISNSKYIPIYSGADGALDKIYFSTWAGHGPTGTGNHQFERDVSNAINHYRKSVQKYENIDQLAEDNVVLAHKCQEFSSKPLSLNARLVGYSPSNPVSPVIADIEAIEFEHNGKHYTSPNDPTFPLAQLAQECIDSGYIIPDSIDSYHHSLKTSVKAAEALISMVNEKPHFYDLIALGPLTNIAEAILLDPEFLSKLKSFSWLGGSLGPGNITKYSEFNAYCDSLANKIVFERLLSMKKANNISDNDTITPLKATIVGWDAGVNASFHVDEYKSIFSTSEMFKWPDNSDSDEIMHEKYLFAYIVRKFASKYEEIVQEAVDANRATLQGLHHSHDIDVGVNNEGSKPDFLSEEDDHTAVSINVVDLLAMASILCPEIIVETRDGLFNVVNNTKSEQNGMTVDMTTCDIEMMEKLQEKSKIIDVPQNQLFSIEYVTKIDIKKYEQILRKYAHSKETQ